MDDVGPRTPDTTLPAGPQPAPTGLRYLVGTWSGRLLLVNTIVFLLICLRTKTLMMPGDAGVLVELGAKDVVKIAQGEFWRFLTPIFIHIGIIHFAFNSYFLYTVGYQLERLLGAWWFLAIYLVAGIVGNAGSAAFSVNLSAGASSSLFGLLGAGLLLEWRIGSHIKAQTGRRPKQRAYLMTVLINLGIGLAIPFIDNSAHLGGLAAGVLLTGAMVNLRANQLQPRRIAVGVLLLLLLIGGAGVCAYRAMTPRLVAARLEQAGDKAEDKPEDKPEDKAERAADRVHLYSQALTLDPEASGVVLKRIRALFALGETSYAMHDVRFLLTRGLEEPGLAQWADELERSGHGAEAGELRSLLAQGHQGL